MHNPQEGVTPDGLIRTGAAHDAIGSTWTPVLQAAIDAVAGRASLYVYGSVATGCAVVARSDVDLLSIGLSPQEAERISMDLSARFSDVCREVSVAPAAWKELEADDDEGYGLRVFVRHYSAHLAGDDPARDLPAFPADKRAARGFNGDIALHLQRWQIAADDDADVAGLATHIARKTLLAVAGLVSIRDSTWTTDRRISAWRWRQIEPGVPVDTLVEWLDTPPRDMTAVHRVLDGPRRRCRRVVPLGDRALVPVTHGRTGEPRRVQPRAAVTPVRSITATSCGSTNAVGSSTLQPGPRNRP